MKFQNQKENHCELQRQRLTKAVLHWKYSPWIFPSFWEVVLDGSFQSYLKRQKKSKFTVKSTILPWLTFLMSLFSYVDICSTLFKESKVAAQRDCMKKVFFKISQNLQESICAGVSFSIKWHLHQIETPVQVLYCELCEVLKKANYINVYEQLFLKSNIFVGVSFRKTSAFYYKQNRQLFHYEETGLCVFLRVLELLNDIVFQNSYEWLLLKTPQETKTCSKSTTKKVLVLPQLMLFGCLYH